MQTGSHTLVIFISEVPSLSIILRASGSTSHLIDLYLIHLPPPLHLPPPSFFFLEGIIYQYRWEWPYIESLPHVDFFSPSPFLRSWSRLDLPPVHNRKGRRNCLWTLFESFSEAPSPARAGHIIFQINFDGLYCLQLIVKFLSDTLHCQWILKSTILNRCQRF